MQILIPGAFNHYKDIMRFITKYPQLIKHAEVYDGVQNSKWNGGRIDCLAPTELDFNKIKTYNNLGIGVTLTFSNKDIDINSEIENNILYKLNNCSLNGVIVRNDNLRQHIRDNYKNLNVQLSIAENKGLNFDYLISKEKLYDAICPRPEYVFNQNFLAKCNPSKYKVMVNNACQIRCRYWDLHANAVSEAVQNGIDNYKQAFAICECWKRTGKIVTPTFTHKCKVFKGDFNKIDVDYSTEDIKKAIELGYDKFKISGRELKSNVYIDEVEIYIKRILAAYFD